MSSNTSSRCCILRLKKKKQQPRNTVVLQNQKGWSVNPIDLLTACTLGSMESFGTFQRTDRSVGGRLGMLIS